MARPPRSDLLLAGALAAWGQLEVWAPRVMPGVEPAGDRLLLSVAALLATLPVALRSRAPVPALALTTLAVSLPELAGASQDALAPFAAMLLVAFSVGARARTVTGAVALLGALLLVGGS